jgi:hypothetical protein
MRYLQGGSSLADQPADSPVDDAENPHEEDYAASKTPSGDDQRQATADSEEIDVSDWEVTGPDV